MKWKSDRNKKVKYPHKFKQLCHDAVYTFMEIMRLQQFNCGFVFAQEEKEYVDREGYTTRAEIHVDRRYLKATITVYPNVFEDWKKGIIDNKEVGDIMAHECAHMLTHHLYQLAVSTYKDEGEMQDAREVLTELVSRLAVNIVELKNHEKHR